MTTLIDICTSIVIVSLTAIILGAAAMFIKKIINDEL
jgi:hypothetical protein